MDFRNSTDLDSARLERLLLRHTLPYRHDKLRVRVRNSRGADFSGTCYYTEARIFVNLGQHVVYPYRLGTHIAKSQSNRTHWWRETYRLVVHDGYQLCLFVYLHELFHYLVKAAGRNPRQKESMCDRFATRALVDHFGCPVIDTRGRAVPRERWDFQDLRRFIARAPQVRPQIAPVQPPAPRAIPVTIRGARAGARRPQASDDAT